MQIEDTNRDQGRGQGRLAIDRLAGMAMIDQSTNTIRGQGIGTTLDRGEDMGVVTIDASIVYVTS